MTKVYNYNFSHFSSLATLVIFFIIEKCLLNKLTIYYICIGKITVSCKPGLIKTGGSLALMG